MPWVVLLWYNFSVENDFSFAMFVYGVGLLGNTYNVYIFLEYQEYYKLFEKFQLSTIN